MEIVYSETAQADIEYWKKHGTDTIRKRISQLIESIENSPFVGVGKPEPLKYNLNGKWSRWIDRKNRIIYSVENEQIWIYSLLGHYSNK